MQPASAGPEPISPLKRYGPLAVIVVLLVGVGLAVVLGGGGDDEPTATDDTAPTSAPGEGTVGAPPPLEGMPLTYEEATEQGVVDDYDWGERCDPETGRVRIPSVYAAPCVPVFQGDNGGATATGVTAESIRIVRYVADENSDLAALLTAMGANDTSEQQRQTLDDYLALFTSTTESYGRQIELIDYDATGPAEDVVASKADAVTIVTELEPFAVLGGPALDRGTFAAELARSGVLCVGCGLAVPDKLIQENAPYLWGASATVNQFLETLAAWVNQSEEAAAAAGRPEAGTNALFAGDEAYHERERKTGVIHFEQDPPIFDDTADATRGDFENAYVLRESYLFDLPSMPEKATELVAKFKQEEITTVVFIGDPIMPIYLTSAATEQEYFPEWIFTGTTLTDSNTFGRQYDQTQMAHAFGLSNLPVPLIQDLQEAIVLYRWYFGGDDSLPPAENQYALIAPSARFLAHAIHMAGPDLTVETFARGLFRIPPSGGGPTTPQLSFGNWGLFAEPDFAGIDDSVEIWWDPDVEVEDERGTMGMGVWRRSHEGARFTANDALPPNPFNEPETTFTVLEELPAEDVPPDYPPPPGAPAAG